MPRESRALLAAIGKWMNRFGESIYGTTASPFTGRPGWGCCTAKPGRLYALVFDWPGDGTLRLPPTRNAIRRAFPLDEAHGTLQFRKTGEGIEIDLPARAPDPWDSVIALELDGGPETASRFE
jgi:hypothetical protein